MATTINAGRVAMVPKGTWSSSTAYSRLDVVQYNGSSYVAIQDSTGQNPSTATTYWQLLAAGITASDYYTKTQVDAKIAESSPMRVTATWDASASAYTYESAVDVDTMYQSFYSQGKVLELHLVNGNYNGLVLTCHGGYTSNNERHLKFSGSGDGKLIEADVVGTVVTVSYVDINEINEALYGKQDKTLATSTIPATGLLPNVVYDYGTTDTVSVTLAAGDAGVANIWCFVFTAQTAACTVTLPSSVVLGNEYAWDMVAGRRYEVSIMDNVAIVNYSD